MAGDARLDLDLEPGENPPATPAARGPRELLPGDGSARLWTAFLPSRDAAGAFDALREEVPWGNWQITMFGRTLPEPRLSAWVGDEGTQYRYSGRTRVPLQWTPTLAMLRERCEAASGASFNAVLANLYRDGRDSMGWHADDEPENGPNPTIASVSLGAERRFDFRHRDTGETVRTVLPSGSLLVMSGPCQRHWLHQVPRTARVDGPRINLTFRLVRGNS